MSVTKCIRKKDGKKKAFYRAQVYVRGIRLADRVFDTQAAAYTWHDQEKEILEADPSRIKHRAVTFEEVLERFLTEAKRRQKRSSYQALEARIPYLKSEVLLPVKMHDFDSRTMDAWIKWLLRHPSALGNKRKSFLHELKYLGVVLNWYRSYEDAKFLSPVTKRHREMVHFKEVVTRRPDYFARPEEIRAWITWLKSRRNPVYYRLATFLVLTGARVGEASGLLWDVIDLNEGSARICRRVHWDHWTRRPILEQTTKTEESVRSVMLPDELIAILKEMKAEQRGEGPVFQGKPGELLRYNAIQSAFNAGFVALGLPWRSTHICRHTYATMALLATKDLSGVQASLGHKSYKVTERYAKAIALLNRDMNEKTAKIFALNPDHTQNHTSPPGGEKIDYRIK